MRLIRFELANEGSDTRTGEFIYVNPEQVVDLIPDLLLPEHDQDIRKRSNLVTRIHTVLHAEHKIGNYCLVMGNIDVIANKLMEVGK